MELAMHPVEFPERAGHRALGAPGSSSSAVTSTSVPKT
jgi:hypothetical protein